MNGQDVLQIIRQSAPPEFEKAVLACSVGFNLDDEIAASAIQLVVGNPEFNIRHAIETMKETSFTDYNDNGIWRISPSATRRFLAMELHRALPNFWLPLQQLFADHCSRKSRELWPDQRWDFENESYDWNAVMARHFKEEECYHLLMIPGRQQEAATILRQMFETSSCPSEVARVICLYIEDCQAHTGQIHPSVAELLSAANSLHLEA